MALQADMLNTNFRHFSDTLMICNLLDIFLIRPLFITLATITTRFIHWASDEWEKLYITSFYRLKET